MSRSLRDRLVLLGTFLASLTSGSFERYPSQVLPTRQRGQSLEYEKERMDEP